MIAAVNAASTSTLRYPKGNNVLFGFLAMLIPNQTMKEIIASPRESNPSAVRVILPVNIVTINSATPIAASVIIDCFAASCALSKTLCGFDELFFSIDPNLEF